MTDVALLQKAAEEASWLVERGYPTGVVSDFVATHRALDDAQRMLLRCDARINASFRHHIAREMDPEDVRKRNLALDVSSAVATVSAALAGRELLESAAGICVDPAWARELPATDVAAALGKIASVLDDLRPARVRLVTAPTSADAVKAAAGGLGKRKWKVEIAIEDDVPAALAGGAFVVSTDPVVLDACGTWVNVVGLAIEGLTGPRLRLSV